MDKQEMRMIAIGDPDSIYAYEVEENGQVGTFREATDEEREAFHKAQAAND